MSQTPKPEHPGAMLYEELAARGLTVTDAAALLGYGRPSISNVLNGHYAITPNMALALERNGFASAEMWLNLQQQFDLWNARHPEGAPDVVEDTQQRQERETQEARAMLDAKGEPELLPDDAPGVGEVPRG